MNEHKRKRLYQLAKAILNRSNILLLGARAKHENSSLQKL